MKNRDKWKEMVDKEMNIKRGRDVKNSHRKWQINTTKTKKSAILELKVVAANPEACGSNRLAAVPAKVLYIYIYMYFFVAKERPGTSRLRKTSEEVGAILLF